MNQNYIDTVRLLLAIAPAVFASGRFAMKGGTALNLFVQEMPRLSVDIDLVFVDHRPDRQAALQAIALELAAVQVALAGKGLRAHLPANPSGDDVKLVVSNDSAQVKVEVNFVFRGTALPVETQSLVATAQDLFTTDLTAPVLATAELYGSKLVAAMDRQHPRDIFDVMHMLDHFGWQESIVDCFVAYLAGHNRPVHEVLFPKTKPLEPAFTNEFAGMTRDTVELDTLMQMQARLIKELPKQLTTAHRGFLMSLKSLAGVETRFVRVKGAGLVERATGVCVQSPWRVSFSGGRLIATRLFTYPEALRDVAGPWSALRAA